MPTASSTHTGPPPEVDIVRAATMPWGESLTAHRRGTMAHKRLFEGTEGSLDNYIFVLADEGADYYSPRHRHLWDQVRFCLSGSIPIGLFVDIEHSTALLTEEHVMYERPEA